MGAAKINYEYIVNYCYILYINETVLHVYSFMHLKIIYYFAVTYFTFTFLHLNMKSFKLLFYRNYIC